MITLIAILTIHQVPRVPAATTYPVYDSALISAAKSASLAHCVISADGSAMFVFGGKYQRFLFGKPGKATAEDIFYFNNNDKAATYTTSQCSHVYRQVKGLRLSRIGNPELLAAPTKNSLIIGATVASLSTGKPIPQSYCVSKINWTKRGIAPNSTLQMTRLPNEKGLRGVAATVSTGYVLRVGEKESKLVALKLSGQEAVQSNVGTTAPIFFDSYDPGARRFVREANADNMLIGLLGSTSTKTVKVPAGTKLFQSRGKVFAQRNRVHELTRGDTWKEFGSEFNVLAKSANGTYWLIEDSSGRGWKVRFR